MTFFSPVSLHLSTSSITTRMAWVLSGAGMTLAPARTQPRTNSPSKFALAGECRCTLGLGELDGGGEGLQLLHRARLDTCTREAVPVQVCRRG